MKRNLYSNMRRMTTAFCIALAGITLVMFVLRLTVFRDMADDLFDKPYTASEAPEPGGDDENSNGEEQLFEYQINRKIYFSNPDAKGNVLIRNMDTNDYYMSVDIILLDTGDSVLFTGFIKPGESRDSLKLDRRLENGVYACTAEISAYDPDSLEKMGDLKQDVTLYIGEKP